MAEPATRPTVAVTRSVEDNAPLAAELRRRGFDVVPVPLVEVAGPSDGGDALDRAVASLDGGTIRWVVVTSVTGVRALSEAMIRVRGGRPWPARVEVAVVGPGTASEARAAGMPVALVPPVATAASLVEAFPAADPNTAGRRVLAPLAELAGSTVEDGLGAKGWSVVRVEAYRTGAPPRPAAVDRVTGAEAVTFFSPSVVDRWIERFGPVVPPLVVCIGPSTAGRAVARGLQGVVMAEPHTEDGVIEALVATLDPR